MHSLKFRVVYVLVTVLDWAALSVIKTVFGGYDYKNTHLESDILHVKSRGWLPQTVPSLPFIYRVQSRIWQYMHQVISRSSRLSVNVNLGLFYYSKKYGINLITSWLILIRPCWKHSWCKYLLKFVFVMFGRRTTKTTTQWREHNFEGLPTLSFCILHL